MSSIDPRGLFDEGGPPRPLGPVLSDGTFVDAGACRGATPLTPRSVLIVLENEASEVFEIMGASVPPISLRNR